MNNEIQKTIARLIVNTKRKKRVNDLYTIANDILLLKKYYGSLKKVNKEAADISPNMLNRFLSVLNIDKSIIPLIKSRRIDNINAVYYIQKLKPQEQLYISNLVVQGRVNSQDIRAITPLKKKFPNKSIQELCKMVLKSKDKKRYLIKFEISDKTNLSNIKNGLEFIVPAEDFQIEEKNKIGTIFLSKYAYASIKKYCDKKSISYKKFVASIINQN